MRSTYYTQIYAYYTIPGTKPVLYIVSLILVSCESCQKSFGVLVKLDLFMQYMYVRTNQKHIHNVIHGHSGCTSCFAIAYKGRGTVGLEELATLWHPSDPHTYQHTYVRAYTYTPKNVMNSNLHSFICSLKRSCPRS